MPQRVGWLAAYWLIVRPARHRVVTYSAEVAAEVGIIGTVATMTRGCCPSPPAEPCAARVGVGLEAAVPPGC